MAQTIIDNINSILNTKSELQTILVENGQEGGDVFSQYPDQFRAAIASGGSDLSNYPDYAYLEENYPDFSYIESYYVSYSYLYSYIGEALSGIDVDIDLSSYITSDELAQELSSYVTKTELSNQSYITMGDVSACGYITESDVAQMGYITSIPSEYITQDELSANSYLTQHQDLSSYALKSEFNSYVSKTELSNQSYITMNDVSVCGYATYSYIYDNYVKKGADITTPAATIGNLRVEGELKVNANTYSYNIIPQENNTYTLGDSSHYYSNTYTYNLALNTHNIKQDEYSIGFQINGNNTMRMFTGSFRPWIDKGATLGSSSNQWSTTYTYNLYTTYIAGTTYVSSYQAMYFGTDRPWCLYGSGSGSTEETILTNKSSAGKWFRVKDYYGNNILSIYEINSAGNKIEIPAATYITNLYTENVSYTSGKSKILMNDRNVDIYANNKKMINLSDYNGLVPIQANVNLGGSSNKWGSTYISNLYADTIHNFIWTGTSAEYASLSDYTTYQIYMIKES